PFVKDGINNAVVEGRHDLVNPAGTGTKASAHYRLTVPGGGSREIRLRLTAAGPADTGDDPLGGPFDATFAARIQEADAFYATVIPASLNADEARVMRQALAGMLWSKQFYFFDLDRWLDEHGSSPLRRGRKPAVR